MNKLEKILGIKFPEDTKISFASNFSHKIKKNSIFFGLPGTKIHGSKYCERAIDWEHHWLFIIILITKMKI